MRQAGSIRELAPGSRPSTYELQYKYPSSFAMLLRWSHLGHGFLHHFTEFVPKSKLQVPTVVANSTLLISCVPFLT